MKKITLSILLFVGSFCSIAQTVLQENFTTYTGSVGTIPVGWYFSYNGAYTSTTYSGASGPNSYKFGVNNDTIITPAFSNADSVSFWIKGSGTDAISSLNISESNDNVIWTSVADINNISTSGTNFGFPIQTTSTYLRFVYTKSAGNVAFDDFNLIKSFTNSSNGDSTAIAQGKIKVYFNTPVDTNLSTGVNAIYLNGTLMDTLLAYFNRAQYSIDITQYDYISSAYTDTIAKAINSAYDRGVNIRWIYDGAASNSGLALLNSNIHTLGSPTTSTYGIMHNKFVVIDGQSTNPNDAIVITGSPDWNINQFENDYNNVIIFQDSTLASAYTKEFNQMWGDVGLVPNTTNAKFGPDKNSLTAHDFLVGGVPVELYFSPQDGTNSHIVSSMSTANTDLYFGIYTFTASDISDVIDTNINHGVYTAGIIDQYSETYTPYTVLSPVMGNKLILYTGSEIYHNKMAVVDPSDVNSNPQVITGSYNWTATAETKNDENTVIVHSPIVANIYYQSFFQNFKDLGGHLQASNQTSSSETITACKDYMWKGANYTTSGTYTDTIPNVAGGDSVMFLNLTINTVNTGVIQSDNVLTSEASGGTFQWIDCNNLDSVIIGATSQSFVTNLNGNYAVIITQNGCVDTSACINVTTTGIKENGVLAEFEVYPNPVNNELTIENQGNINQIEVYNLTGQLLQTSNAQSTMIKLDFSAYEQGIYLVKIHTTDGQVATSRVVKE